MSHQPSYALRFSPSKFMRGPVLTNFVTVRNLARSMLMRFRIMYLTKVWGHVIHPSSRISFQAYLDKTHPHGITIGEDTIVTRGVVVLSHDFSRRRTCETKIGARCFIGVNAIIMPGVTIGDEVIVGAGSVVTRDVESGTLVAGNPARIIKRVRTTRFGMMAD